MKILIFGLPGSGKSTLAKPLANLLGGIWLNWDQVRKDYNNTDYSYRGIRRHFKRMSDISDGILRANKSVIIDMVCPTELERKDLNADYKIWMDTISEISNDLLFEKKIMSLKFEKPIEYDYHVSKWFDNTHEQLAQVVKHFMKIKIGETPDYVRIENVD